MNTVSQVLSKRHMRISSAISDGNLRPLSYLAVATAVALSVPIKPFDKDCSMGSVFAKNSIPESIDSLVEDVNYICPIDIDRVTSIALTTVRSRLAYINPLFITNDSDIFMSSLTEGIINAQGEDIVDLYGENKEFFNSLVEQVVSTLMSNQSDGGE